MLLECVIALMISIIMLAVLSAPAWLVKLAPFGGLAFVILVLILLIEWLFGKIQSLPRR